MFKAVYQCDKCKGRLFDLLVENGEIEIKCGKCRRLVKISVEELSQMIAHYREEENHTSV